MNCDKEILESNYCNDCGQLNTDKNVTLKFLIKDFFQDYMELDSKLFKSLPLLIIKPGFLTLEFIHGKRVKYISPLRFYLTISIIFFLIPTKNTDENNSEPTTVYNSEQMIYTPDSTEQRSDELNFDLFRANTNEPPIRIGIAELDSIAQKLEDSPEQAREEVSDWIEEAMEFEKGTFNNHLFTELAIKSLQINADKTNSFQKSMTDHFPTVMFCLLPYFALVMLPLFRGDKKKYVSHLIFSLHIHSFAFLVLVLAELLEWVNINISIWLMVTIPIYILIAAKKVYKKSFIGTFFRLTATGIPYLIGVVIAFITNLAYTFYTY